MAACKKQIKKTAEPSSSVRWRVNPNAFYSDKPAWSFQYCDGEFWAITSEEAQKLFWFELLPRLKHFEQKTWSDILVGDKKFNHEIDAYKLNKIAQDRIVELHLENKAETVVSLRITGKHRLYGFMRGAVFNVLWYDLDHGDNDTCICRSRKKHT